MPSQRKANFSYEFLLSFGAKVRTGSSAVRSRRRCPKSRPCQPLFGRHPFLPQFLPILGTTRGGGIPTRTRRPPTVIAFVEVLPEAHGDIFQLLVDGRAAAQFEVPPVNE